MTSSEVNSADETLRGCQPWPHTQDVEGGPWTDHARGCREAPRRVQQGFRKLTVPEKHAFGGWGLTGRHRCRPGATEPGPRVPSKSQENRASLVLPGIGWSMAAASLMDSSVNFCTSYLPASSRAHIQILSTPSSATTRVQVPPLSSSTPCFCLALQSALYSQQRSS